MWGARGTTLLGLAVIAVAGLFNGRPLYVPGIALVALGLGTAAWVRAAAHGARIERTLGAARVVEDEPLLVELEVRGGRVAPPSGQIEDPLLAVPAPLTAGRRRTRLRIQARFARRGLRTLPPPSVVFRDPLGLAQRRLTAAGPGDELLVLPRVEPVLAPAGGGEAATGGRGRPLAAAEVDLEGLRPHRPGIPASRIAWPVFARTGELHERVMRADADARPLVVLDLRSAASERDADAAVRAATSLCVHLAERGGVSLLLAGDRRPLLIGAGGHGWPQAHVRLALARVGEGPAAEGLAGRRRAIIWVAARALREPPRALARASGAVRMLVVPGSVPGRRPAFTVAGCTGYELERVRRVGASQPAGTAGAA